VLDEALGALMVPCFIEAARPFRFLPTATADRVHTGEHHGQGAKAQQSRDSKAKEEGTGDDSRYVD
jgi:hypothetical protein